MGEAETTTTIGLGTRVACWATLVVGYRLLVGRDEAAEWVAGAVAAALATAAMVSVLREVPPFRPDWRWAGVLLRRLPVAAMVDSCRVVAAFVGHLASGRALAGAFRVVPIDPGGDDPASAARRALVIAGASVPPNTLVVSIDRQSGLMLVHELVPRPATPGRGDREWPL